MSTAPRKHSMAGGRMTADDFYAIGETEERYELVDGVVIMTPSPRPVHREIVQEILAQFRSQQPDRRTFAEIDVFFGEHHVYRPDLAVYAPGRLPADPDRLASPPDLLIEVVSPSTRTMDLVTKRDDYERFGVGEYWAVDVAADRIRCWRRDDQGRYAESITTSGLARCGSVQGLSLDADRVTALWRG